MLALTGQFEAHTFRNDNEQVIPYRLFKPERDLAKSYPLIIYLHGSAGRGTDNVKQISGGNIYGARVWATTGSALNGNGFPYLAAATGRLLRE